MQKGDGPVSRATGWVVAGLAGLAMTTGLMACGAAAPKPQATVSAYLQAWGARHWGALAALVDRPPADFATVNAEAYADLRASSVSYQAGVERRQHDVVSIPLTSQVMVRGYGSLLLHSTLTLHQVKAHWLVEWSPRVIASVLGPGDRFSVSSNWPDRAAILGSGGATLTPTVPMVTVGLEGSAVRDPAAAQAALVAAGVPEVTAARALAAAAARPTEFVPVETVAEAQYLRIKPIVYPVPGTRFQTHGGRAALTPDLAAHIVGDVGPITAEELKKLGAPYSATDNVGQTGLEAVDERQLAGSPATTVQVIDARGNVVSMLGTTVATPGQAVQTTIDPRVQQAAEGALNGVTEPAAMVVLRASTGELLASVSRPTSQGFDLALDGALAPGSTFKVVTTAALLEAGLTAVTPATCPASITVDGKVFHNYESESLANLTLAQAFARSCNTAFIGLAARLSDQSLPAAAAQYGIGDAFEMGLSAFAGKVPTPTGAVDKAATAIGQAQVEVSPLVMAGVAAAVDSGTVRKPRLVQGAPDDTAAAVPLDSAVVSSLRTMMAAVVSAGTATGAGLPAGTFGKTGTAEFGAGPNPPTHAWFIGFRGDLAFAVVVYGGGVGGTVAAPLAAKLLTALGPST